MNVLVACEFSGVVRDAFIERGHNAWSCDLLKGEGRYWTRHFQTDVLDELDNGWDLMIAHPPCTRLANSGVRWLAERNLWSELSQAIWFFRALQTASIPRIAIENPIPHKYARVGFRDKILDPVDPANNFTIGVGKYDQIIQPWQFGHGETKATCLWLKNLPELEPTNIVEGREQRIWKMSPGADRAKLRSITYKGFAEAMADQWG